MNTDQLFQISSTLAMIAWIVLIIFHKTMWVGKVLIGTVVAALCLLYAILIFKNFGTLKADTFNSLEAISLLFSNREALLAGWIHYLAFDLFTGIYIVNNARVNGIKIWWLLPCLFFTFMLGPFGLLLYLIIRWAHTKTYWVDVD